MDQLSRPVVIALAATILLVPVWLFALRPKASGVADAPPAPVQSVAKAERAPAAAAAPPSRAGPEGANARDAAVRRDIGRGKVVVLLFWNATSADDVATRDAVRGLDRHRGAVAVHVVPIGRVADYESITQGVAVNQSPTTLVIDRRRRARVVVGLSEPRELSQAVGDALAARR